MGCLRGALAPLNKVLPLLQRMHLPIMERGIKGVRLMIASIVIVEYLGKLV